MAGHVAEGLLAGFVLSAVPTFIPTYLIFLYCWYLAGIKFVLSCVNSGETLALLMRIFDLGSGSLALGSGSLAIDACYEVVSQGFKFEVEEVPPTGSASLQIFPGESNIFISTSITA